MSQEGSSFFRRNADGSWTTLRAVTINHGPRSTEIAEGQTFRPGTLVDGFAVVQWLEFNYNFREEGGTVAPPGRPVI